MTIIPVLLSGGSGTRLWPLSRKMYPKQLLPMTSDKTMIQETMLRLNSLDNVHPPLVVCNEDHRFLVAEQLSLIKCTPDAVVLEPVGRNTAPAVAVASLLAQNRVPDSILLVLPADHVIRDAKAFCLAVQEGALAAQDGRLVTFGVVPKRAETGYGYIQAGRNLEHGQEVVAFMEKPDLGTAQNYVESGQYLWNSGMFMFTPKAFLTELKRFRPDILNSSEQALEKAVTDLGFLRLDREAFSNCPEDSIDYAVMEKTDKAAVVPLDAGWNDIGSWFALYDEGSKDNDGNVALGDVLVHDAHNNYINATSKLVAAVGISDHVIVETRDAVLVAHKDAVQDVKILVDKLKGRGREEALLHKRVYRPWGAYEGMDQGARFQVKRITVKPGQVLSLQKHHHRAEHWIVVSGTAKITRGKDEFILTEDQSTYIPLGEVHRLENPGCIPLELIEVQTGSYLGEDDIVRMEDIYGRLT